MIRHQLFAEPRGRGRGWYIADAEMRDMLGVIYISKRAAVASIRCHASGNRRRPASFLYGKRIHPGARLMSGSIEAGIGPICAAKWGL
jgi:hypothetical protein